MKLFLYETALSAENDHASVISAILAPEAHIMYASHQDNKRLSLKQTKHMTSYGMLYMVRYSVLHMVRHSVLHMVCYK